jgi:type VI secretion system protein ImpJ
MKIFKPVWTEGLFITQHHFQQLDRYHEALVDERIDASLTFPWGVIELEFDERALEAGQVKVTEFEAVLPEGTVVTCGEKTNDVLQRAIGDAFPASARSLDVYVALPRASETLASVDLEGKPGAVTRYVREPRIVSDVNSGSAEHTVHAARPNLRILFGSEQPEGYDSIRVGSLIRSSSGAAIFKSTSIPPVMRIGASEFRRWTRASATLPRRGANAARHRSTFRRATLPSSGC